MKEIMISIPFLFTEKDYLNFPYKIPKLQYLIDEVDGFYLVKGELSVKFTKYSRKKINADFCLKINSVQGWDEECAVRLWDEKDKSFRWNLVFRNKYLLSKYLEKLLANNKAVYLIG